MSKHSAISELLVRVAHAERERDAAIERAESRWHERERMITALWDISQGSLEFLEDHLLVRETAAEALPEEIRAKL